MFVVVDQFYWQSYYKFLYAYGLIYLALYFFMVINVILVDVFHDVTKNKKATQLCSKKRHKKLYCLAYVFRKISFKCL